MIILDKPYVSKFLQDTIKRLNIPVLKNDAVEELKLSEEIPYLTDEQFVEKYKEDSGKLLYCNSENPINWIANNLAFTRLPAIIQQFKDKVQFRKMLEPMYPEFYYKKVRFDELEALDVSEMKFPFIIKPSVGFFSMGVYKVVSRKAWVHVNKQLQIDALAMAYKYPPEVVDANKLIIEENIDGDEFAIDVYYDRNGNPVILNVLEHIFSSGEDVSDRVYITSKNIIEKHYDRLIEFFEQMGQAFSVNNFPMHVEVRIDRHDNILPIEVNPMRFAGWCTTDLAQHAYGINVYEYYFMQKKPDWKHILKDKAGKVYSIVVADVPKDINIDSIKGFEFELFKKHFQNPLEIRKVDYSKHGVFAFLFAETDEQNMDEIEYIVKSDLKEYILFQQC
ncbi:ATP-grasp domain-containing protein [Desulfuribacillus alkaliarsenatis]|uniref:ATP-grasp domain-containing protein n=1 Tax=Desulfuribacillus alkaliarsenatis TaxID=766136 RepID=A0A1E5FZN0_9FIRM|nr:ATP-grasp domain-containing protein [Desulfuribacillus alkaliarsenatis]OEF95696.1 ATP-grasp domain-containing protein [Desulfuribacillus alkaliarsenatis]